MRALFFFVFLAAVCLLGVVADNFEGTDVTVLDLKGFKKHVDDSSAPLLVEFFAPWCSACKDLEPTMEEVASELKGKLKVVAVNCEALTKTCQVHRVNGYPSIKFFPGTKTPHPYTEGKLMNDYEDFEGSKREASEIVEWAVKKIPKHAIPVTESSLDDFLARNSSIPKALVATKGELSARFQNLAAQFKGRLYLGHSTSSYIFGKYDIHATPTLLVLGDEGVKDVYDFSTETVNEFLNRHALADPNKKPKAKKAKAASGSDVVTLFDSDFDEEVLSSDIPVLVKFYAPWCGHCKKLAPAWDEAATQLKGKVKIAKVDCTMQSALCQRFSVSGYPTILEFPGEKKYDGPRDADGIVKYALDLAGGGSGGASAPPKKAKKAAAKKDDDEEDNASGEAVVTLTDSNFDEKVLDGGKAVYIVEFYAPWCGHCKSLAPNYEAAAKRLKGKVTLGKVDATVEKKLADRYGISGFPTLKVFTASSPRPQEYTGGRDTDAIVEYALELLEDEENEESAGSDGSAEADDPPGTVVELTESNFESKVINGPHKFFLVEFFAPWCGHCKKLAPEWEKAAKRLKGEDVRLGTVDATIESDLAKQYGVEGYPTLKVFRKGSSTPEAYGGGREADSIVEYVLEDLLGDGSNAVDESDVVVLTEDNFEEEVLQSEDLWIVEFYAPWCGHCKKLTPEWAKAATKLKGKIKVGKVDATQNQELAKKYEAKGFPTLKSFTYNKNSPGSFASRYAPDIEEEALALIIEPTPVHELKNDDDLKEHCGDQLVGMCVMLFVPSLPADDEDADAIKMAKDERESYLKVLTVLGGAFRGQPVRFVWADGQVQRSFLEGFGEGHSDLPIMLAVNARKMAYARYLGALGGADAKRFLSDVLGGKERIRRVSAIPDFV